MIKKQIQKKTDEIEKKNMEDYKNRKSMHHDGIKTLTKKLKGVSSANLKNL